MQNPLTTAEWERYERQLALPEISAAQQIKLKSTHLLMVGAGGLGAAALPYLAAAGIGHITIMDHDEISTTNLHRQTIYQDGQNGAGKAEAAAAYLRALNPHIEVTALPQKVTSFPEEEENGHKSCKINGWEEGMSYDIILDGSDNFETKSLLNQISIETSTPLISASVNRFEGQCGIFAGYAKSAPCYHCLFPELPTDARNCNEAGILGTAAGLTGMFQAHLTLMYLLGIGDVTEGAVLSMDFKSMRVQKLSLPKDESCAHCQNAAIEIAQKQEAKMPELLSFDELRDKDHLIVDVRTSEEIQVDPIEGAFHMELSKIPVQHAELPDDKLLAFVCAGNVRSVQAAEFLIAMGRGNVCVLDKFSL